MDACGANLALAPHPARLRRARERRATRLFRLRGGPARGMHPCHMPHIGERMTTFDDREKGFERKFALDQEQEFKASARRNRMLGEWAAGLMGLAEDRVATYAQAVVRSDLEQPGEEDVLQGLRRPQGVRRSGLRRRGPDEDGRVHGPGPRTGSRRRVGRSPGGCGRPMSFTR